MGNPEIMAVIIDAQAKKLYYNSRNAMGFTKPEWDDISPSTRALWYYYAEKASGVSLDPVDGSISS